MSKLESLWVRLHVEGRIRVCDAVFLRHLNVPPFDASCVFQVDAAGYVVTVGMPGATVPVSAPHVRQAFELRYGVPQSPDRVAADAAYAQMRRA